MTKIAIIGGGLSGMTAAHFLSSNADVTVFDKARGVSGRMATRRADSFAYDHGAQYFTARSDAFLRFLTPMIQTGHVCRWNARYAKYDDHKIVKRQDWSQGEPRFVAVPGMNALVKHIAREIKIETRVRIKRLKRTQQWTLIGDQNKRWTGFDWVISATPAPQALELLPPDFSKLDEIKTCDMQPCFAVMLGFSKEPDLDFDAAHFINSDLSWAALNSRKPGRSARSTLVIHSSHSFASLHLQTDRNQVRDHLISAFRDITGSPLSCIEQASVHRWLYANNARRRTLPTLLDEKLRLGACGDWTEGGRVEGAFLSGLKLAQAINLSCGADHRIASHILAEEKGSRDRKGGHKANAKQQNHANGAIEARTELQS